VIKGQLTYNFYPEVHVLAGTLVLVVKANSLGGSRANWHHAKPYTRVPREPTQDEALNFTSNPIEWLLASPQGISPRTPHKSPGDGNKQSPTRANAPPLL
jgi:hypothetical protein